MINSDFGVGLFGFLNLFLLMITGKIFGVVLFFLFEVGVGMELILLLVMNSCGIYIMLFNFLKIIIK